MKLLLNILRSSFVGLMLLAATGIASAQQVTSLSATRGSVADLVAGGSIRSTPNGTYTLLVQSDGNLVIYNSSCVGNSGCAVWASGAAGGGSYFLSMQNDGNLVMYRGTPSNRGAAQAVWNSGVVAGVGAYFAALGDDANLVVYRGSPSDNRGAFWSRFGGYVAPDNDAFGGRRNLASATSGTNLASTSGATLEAGEPQPAATVNSTVWWQWTAPANGTVAFNTFGSDFDAFLTAWTGTSLAGLSGPIWNDNADGTTQQSRLSWGVTAGTVYQIRAGSLSSQGSVNLNWAFTQPQTINFPGLPHRLLGLPPTFSISATASSGLAVSFASSTPSVCTVSGSVVAILGPGTCTITASQAGNGSFDAASLSRSFTVAASFAADRIAAGWYHTCALTNSGTVKCWGYGGTGQLGNGGYNQSNTPVDVSGLTGAVAVTAGVVHTCALTNSGTVKCWGAGDSGQLGNGGTSSNTTPVDVSGLTGAVAVTANGHHTCALTNSGTVKCWGNGSLGELGNGSNNQSNTPVDVSGLTGAVAVTAGGSHTCALTNSGTVKCWGDGGYGQLGNGGTSSNTPVDVSGLTGAVAVTAGWYHTCALTNSGTVKCWGRGSLGELGNGGYNQSNTPVDVSGLTGAVAVTAGGSHTCALTNSGTVKCWGFGSYGQLGNGAGSSTPVDVGNLTGAVALTAAYNHTCALTNSGTVKCWGFGIYGQLGNGGNSNSNAPVTVLNLTVPVNAQHISFAALPSVSQVAAPITLTASASSGFAVTYTSLTPAVCSVSGSTLTLLKAGYCSVAADQFGDVTWAVAPQVVQSTTVHSPIKAGWYYHSCALDRAGYVRCWGLNDKGQLGIGTTANSLTPVLVDGGGSFFSMIDLGDRHSCAVTTVGGVKCWGLNEYGQLGNGSTNSGATPTPVSVVGLGANTRVAAVALGEGFTCALTDAGGVKCWGWNNAGQLGVGQGGSEFSSAPVDVTGLTTGVAAISAARDQACAVMTTGRVKCWGSGIGPAGSVAYTPVEVAALTNAVGVSRSASALTADGAVYEWADASVAPTLSAGLGSGSGSVALSRGLSVSCVLTNAGAVKCWEGNDFGELGNASGVASSTPVQIPGLGSGAVAVAGGFARACAAMADGSLKCWGTNGAVGLLGNGSTATSPTPVTVLASSLLVSPSFTIAAAPASASTTQGSTATYSVTSTSVNGFSDVISYSVTGLPAGATGTFQPASTVGGGSVSLVVSTTAATPAGTYSLQIVGTGGGQTAPRQVLAFGVSLIVAQPLQSDFLLSATPSSVSVPQGSSGTASVSVSTLNGYSAATTLSVTGLPTGVTATFAPATVTGAGSAALTLATAANTPAGSYPLTVRGTGGSLVRTTTLTLVVTAGTGGPASGDIPLPAWALWLLGAGLLAPLWRARGRR